MAVAACAFQIVLNSVHIEAVHELKVYEQAEPLGTNTLLAPHNDSVLVVVLVTCVA